MGSTFVRPGEIGEINEPRVGDPLNWVLLLGFGLCLVFWVAVIAGVAALT